MPGRICVIAVYFGKLPDYFPLFLQGVRYNPEITLFLVTDCDMGSFAVPRNVVVIGETFLSVVKKAKRLLGDDICLGSPYKLCDYRPLYGLIFEEYIKDFAFWGHCDLDMIWGNISRFLPSGDFSRFDRLFQYGHFSLYKNCDRVNRLPLEYPDDPCSLCLVKSTEMPCYFDEVGHIALILRHGLTLYCGSDFADISPKSYRFRLAYTSSGENVDSQRFLWERGRLFRADYTGEVLEERMYIHFQKRQMNVCVGLDAEKFEVAPEGFLNIEEGADKQIGDNLFLGFKDMRRYAHFQLSRIKSLSLEKIMVTKQVRKMRRDCIFHLNEEN